MEIELVEAMMAEEAVPKMAEMAGDAEVNLLRPIDCLYACAILRCNCGAGDARWT